MKKNLFVGTLLTLGATLCATSALAADGRIEFDGGIGSQPFASVGGVPAPNDVRGVLPGGRPWEIGKLRASIRPDGSITVRGKGLILGGGNAVGLPAIPRQVVATLFCGAVEFNSPPASLDAAGDFVIQGALSGVLPSPCATPTLLIRNFAAGQPGAWFAAGIPDN
jgi:hypothetical protein